MSARSDVRGWLITSCALVACGPAATPTLDPSKTTTVAPPAPVAGPSPCTTAAAERARLPKLLAEGRLDRVTRVVARADQLCPSGAPETWATMVETLAALDRWSEASALATTIEESPVATDAAKTAAKSARQRIATYGTKSAPTDESRKLSASAALAAEQGKPKEALEAYRLSWERAHPDGDALLGAGLAARALGEGAEAQRYFDRAAVELGAGPTMPLETDVPNGFEGYVQAAWAPAPAGGKSSKPTLAVAHRSVVSILDARTLREVLRLAGHSLSVTAVAYSPDGRLLASASRDGTARLWDAATGKLLQRLDGHESTVYAVAFSADGRRVATVSADRTARVWDVATGKELATFQRDGGEVLSVAFSPDGKWLLTGADDHVARLYDGTTLAALTTLDGHGGRVRAVAFVETGATIASPAAAQKKTAPLLVTGDDHGTLRVAEIGPKGALKLLHVIDAHVGAIDAIAVAPDGRTVATAGVDQTARTWDARAGINLRTFDGHEIMTSSVTFGADAGTLYSGAYATLREWDATTGKPRQQIRGHASAVESVAVAPDGSAFAAGASDGLISLWPTAAVDGHGATPKLLDAHASTVSALLFGPKSKLLVSGSSDGTVRFWDAGTGVESSQPWKIGFAHALAISPGGDVLAAATVDAGLQRFDLTTKKELPRFDGPGAYGVAFSPDGSRFVVAAAGKAVIVRDAGGAVVHKLLGHTGFVNDVAVSPDGTMAASASSDHTVRLWNLATGAELAVLEGHEAAVLAVAFRPQGSVLPLASASADGTIRLWDTTAHKEVMKLGAPVDPTGTPTAPLGAISTLALSSDGSWLVSGSRDGTMHLWSLPDAQLRLSMREAIGGAGAYAFTPGGSIEVFGNARIFPVCRLGARTLPFELCEERFREDGILARVLAGETFASP